MPRTPVAATRALAVAVAAALLAGCGGGPSRPTAPHALEQVLPAASLDVAAVRSTAFSFVQAYADTASDEGLALSRLVMGSSLSEWVRWLAVQNGQFAGVIRSRVSTVEVRGLQVASTERYDMAQVLLTASVTFQYEPFGAAPFERTRVLDGPLTLVRTGVDEWRVLDVTRDGLAISEGVRDLGDDRVTAGDVTVELHSAFLFEAGWQFNVTVENATGGAIRIDGVTLITATGASDGVATGPLLSIPRGSGAIGILAFPAGTDLTRPVLEVRYATADGTIVTVRARLAATIGAVPGASPTPAPTI